MVMHISAVIGGKSKDVYTMFVTYMKLNMMIL